MFKDFFLSSIWSCQTRDQSCWFQISTRFNFSLLFYFIIWYSIGPWAFSFLLFPSSKVIQSRWLVKLTQVALDFFQCFFFKFHPLTLSCWVLRFLVFYAFLSIELSRVAGLSGQPSVTRVFFDVFLFIYSALNLFSGHFQ